MAEVEHENDTAVPEPSLPVETEDAANDTDQDQVAEDAEEEEECRVCRGPPEEGRPLYSPCRCSGSIGLTHQDCLSSWLAVTRGDGRCELCKTKFHFAPQYAEGAPERLAPYEVFLGLSRRALATWLPFALRLVVAIFLWLVFVPLLTAYLYHGWMHRPSSISTRWKWELVPGDIVSGAVITAVIIVSFLSLMSFGDFLRFHWQDPPPRGVGEEDVEDGHHENAQVVIDEILPELDTVVPPDPRILDSSDEEEEEDEGPNDLSEVRRRRQADAALRRQLDGAENIEEMERIREREAALDARLEGAANEDDIPQIVAALDNQQNAADELEAHVVEEMMRAQEEEDAQEAGDDAHEANRMIREDRREDNGAAPQININNDAGVEPRPAPREPMMNLDDQAEIDINVAVDELLGLRGPFSALVRNLLWLLAFNTTYLGIFAFIPRVIGEAVKVRFNSTTVSGVVQNITDTKSEDSGSLTLLGAISDLNEESARRNTTLQLPDLTDIVLGYLFMAFLVFLWQWGLRICRRFLPRNVEENTEEAEHVQAREAEEPDGDEPNDRGDLLPLMQEMQDAPNERRAFLARRLQELQDAVEGPEHIHERVPDDEVEQAMFGGEHRPDDDAMGRVGEKLALVIEGASAVVKVGVLLFLKMFLLPLLLGIWLDAATLDLFESTVKDRILFSGADVFGSILLHWVVGITFMLLVTVSVLQLREVVHPDLLGPIIRPQEPQPDLLGNLLHEKGTTHAKRMLVSLAIYAALLTIHVWLPARFLVSSGIGSHLPFFRPKIWHIAMPQLQVPIELVVFHLCMLAFLEKYKNRIGQMQHRWLLFMCDKMGLTDQVLPLTVERFNYVGARPVFLEGSQSECPEAINSCTESDTATDEKERKVDGVDSVAEQLPASASDAVERSNKTKQVDPFLYELASRSGNVDEFISSNVEINPSFTACSPGLRNANGARVMSYPETHIQLPSPAPSDPIHRAPQPTESEITSEEKCLLPTTMGTYRLRKHTSQNGKTRIEFWREVRGEPVPRPPEGWDDLGVGGAEVQGRWAWGKEKKSEIEESVAKRNAFFGPRQSRLSSLYLMLKLIVLVLLSWLASTIVVCCALSAPLFLGRFVFFLLRVPDRYVHDPLAFVVGGSIMFPIAGTFAARTDMSSTWRRFSNWVRAFRFPPIRKMVVFVAACLLWFGLSPVFLGSLYDLALLKPRSWFLLSEPTMDWRSLVLSWAVGTMLLNAWAFLCHVGAFTGNFWIEIGFVIEVQQDLPQAGRHENGARIRANPRQADAVELENRTDAAGMSRWQGENGRIARFIDIFKAVLIRWEWDQVDEVVLLHEVTFPVAAHLAASCFCPAIAYCMWLFAVDPRRNAVDIVLPMIGAVDKGLYRMVVFRLLCALELVMQFASSFQAPLQHWFRAAHKAARDDRYLVGEVLMNYAPPGSNQ